MAVKQEHQIWLERAGTDWGWVDEGHFDLIACLLLSLLKTQIGSRCDRMLTLENSQCVALRYVMFVLFYGFQITK